MFKHVFDISETATRSLAALQLHRLADQIAEGSVELGYDEFQTPTPVNEPVDVVVDLVRHRHHAELALTMRWPLGAGRN